LDLKATLTAFLDLKAILTAFLGLKAILTVFVKQTRNPLSDVVVSSKPYEHLTALGAKHLPIL
jgi:hypothetical protein